MNGKYILDEAGAKPILCENVIAWARWFETADRTVAKDKTASAEVSTVFLGIDHNFGPIAGLPLLWETMVFGGALDGEMNRYVSRESALMGHAHMLQKVREAEAAQ